MRRKLIFSAILFAGCIYGCVEPYAPPLAVLAEEILVVDGGINASTNSAQITLSYAVALSSTAAPIADSAAQVTIEEQGGNSFSLTHLDRGTYEVSGLPIDLSKKYRLVIKSQNNKTYQSEFISVMPTPPIDSVTWQADHDGVTINASTHGDAGTSPYYYWSFIETWRYTSSLRSFYKIVGSQGVFREPDEDIFTCYKSDPSSTILVGTTKNQNSNIIREFPVQFLPKGTSRIGLTYSILVQQRSLTEEAYTYWIQLKRTTENLGGLFDPLPGQVIGNITCVSDPQETVIGYFGGSEVTEKRIFIESFELPSYLRLSLNNSECTYDSIDMAEVGDQNPNQVYLLTTWGTPFPLGYTRTSQKDCADCMEMNEAKTGTGASRTPPDFWIE